MIKEKYHEAHMLSWYFLLLGARLKLPVAEASERSFFKNKTRIPAQPWIPEPSHYVQ